MPLTSHIISCGPEERVEPTLNCRLPLRCRDVARGRKESSCTGAPTGGVARISSVCADAAGMRMAEKRRRLKVMVPSDRRHAAEDLNLWLIMDRDTFLEAVD